MTADITYGAVMAAVIRFPVVAFIVCFALVLPVNHPGRSRSSARSTKEKRSRPTCRVPRPGCSSGSATFSRGVRVPRATTRCRASTSPNGAASRGGTAMPAHHSPPRHLATSPPRHLATSENAGYSPPRGRFGREHERLVVNILRFRRQAWEGRQGWRGEAYGRGVRVAYGGPAARHASEAGTSRPAQDDRTPR